MAFTHGERAVAVAAPLQRARRRTWRLGPALLFLPGSIVLALALLAPLAILLRYSVSAETQSALEGFSARHFVKFITDGFYLGVFWNTVSIALTVTIVTLLIGYPLAFSIARSRWKYRGLLLAIVMTPLLTNVVVRSIGWITVLGDHGYLNDALLALGVRQEPIVFIGTSTAVVVALVHLWLPYMVLPIMNAVDALDPSLEEAAQNLGAGGVQRFLRLVLPMTLPGVVAGCTLVFILSLGAFVTPVVLGQMRVWVLPTLIYQQVRLVNWPFAAAMGLILLVSTLIVVHYSTRLLIDAAGRPHLGLASLVAELGLRLADPLSRASLAVETAARRLLPPGRGRRRAGPGPLTLYSVLVYAFLLLPLVGVMLNAFNSSRYVGAVFQGFSLQWFGAALQNANYMESLRISVVLAAITMIVALTFGTLASLGLARYQFPGRGLLSAFFLAPLGVPHITLGIGILIFFHAIGLSTTLTGLVIAHTCIALPYVVRLVCANLVGLGTELEEAARNLGAGTFAVLRYVTLPLVKPALISAAMLAFIVSFDEVTITLLIAGARTTTLPVRIFAALDQNWDMAIMALSAIQIFITLAVVLGIDRTTGLRRLAGNY
jgi:ABC-type spermidine/putrescine transport system permease subunit II